MTRLFLSIGLFFIGLNVNAQSGRYIETNGVQIYYEVYGEGEPLLLLHGFTMSHKSWEPWIIDLSKNYKLVIPDLRGHGNSTNPSKVYTARNSAIDMLGLMDQLNIKRFNALGHSNGALVLTHMAIMDSSRIKSMILISGAPYLTKEAITIMKGVTYENMKSHMEPLHPGGEKQIRMLVEQMRNIPNQTEDINFTPSLLATIKCPTLIIHGDRDKFFNIDIPTAYYNSIPNSYLWIVPDSGHFPAGIYDRISIWSNALVDVIDDFFAGTWN